MDSDEDVSTSDTSIQRTASALAMEFTSETVVLAMAGAFVLFIIVILGVMLSTTRSKTTHKLKSVGTSTVTTTGSRSNLVSHEILPEGDVEPMRI